MDNLHFSEQVRRDLVRDLRRFVGEPVTVEFHEPGRRARGAIHRGTLVAVYPNGFLVDGKDIGKRAFFSIADLFAEHAKVVDGPVRVLTALWKEGKGVDDALLLERSIRVHAMP